MNVEAHAKLTRTLRITGVRDDGMHLIDAEMVSLDLCDHLEIVEVVAGVGDVAGVGGGLDVVGPFGDGVPYGSDNLVNRALSLVGRRARITLDKRIPHGGGLGGGSTDAAAVLRWAGFGSGPGDLAEAARLGADIAFCLVGGRARVTGIGESIEPLAFESASYTLVIPPLRVSTPAAYRAWDELGGPTADGPNDLEPAALVVEPRMAWWRDAIGERTGAAPVVAGSGATWFVEGRRDDALVDLVDEGAEIVVCNTVPATPDTGV